MISRRPSLWAADESTDSAPPSATGTPTLLSMAFVISVPAGPPYSGMYLIPLYSGGVVTGGKHYSTGCSVQSDCIGYHRGGRIIGKHVHLNPVGN